MDWDDLRVFLAVARGEGLSAAGKVLKKDPATVGRRIARLEDSVGVPLFSKSPLGYALTEAGARLVAHAEATEQSVALGLDELAGQSGGLSGQVRIGIARTTAATHGRTTVSHGRWKFWWTWVWSSSAAWL